MFGKNEVTSPFHNNGRSLLVNELFYTIQGEGPDAGRPAIFLRLSKCNLRCYFCDTEFESGTETQLEDLWRRIAHLKLTTGCRLLVITGGEPLLQNIIPLVEKCEAVALSVAIETAGTVYVPGLSDHFRPDRSINGNIIVCSPKTPGLHPELVPLIGALKYIIAETQVLDSDGLPCFSTQIAGRPSVVFRPDDAPHADVYVQAMDVPDKNQHRANIMTARDVSMRHGYRMSLQMHKIVNVP